MQYPPYAEVREDAKSV